MKQTDNKEFKIFIKVIIVVSILALIINTCFGGICEAYSIDFKLLLSIGAIILFAAVNLVNIIANMADTTLKTAAN